MNWTCFALFWGVWHPTPVLLPGKSHGQRSLVGGSPWGRKERLHFHFSLSCIGEGNGNPLQCSCLESPRDGGAWWAAVCGVTQSQTRLKRLSSSSFQRLVNIKKVGGFIDWLHNFWWFALTFTILFLCFCFFKNVHLISLFCLLLYGVSFFFFLL